MAKKTTRNLFAKVMSTLLILLLMIICIGIFAILQFTDFGKGEINTPNNAQQTEAPAVTESPLPSEEQAPATEQAANMSELPEQAASLPVYPVSAERVTYQEGFYFEPVNGNTALMDRIRNLSYNESMNTTVGFDQLSYVRVKYVNFLDQDAEGELICSNTIAQDLVEIFFTLYQARYQIESIRLIDDFGADDNASMSANNTSAFNYRVTTGTTDNISEHSRGVCVDINPLYNPYVSAAADGSPIIVPSNGAQYADRTADFPHKIDENDLCYQQFIAHGFTWGGSWTSLKDYQHFEKK